MRKVLVFDLDDTLYDELTYVFSGFSAVARFLEQEKLAPFAEALSFMRERLAGGRGRIFDDVLLHFSCYSRRNVRRCLSVYRLHKPEIELATEAKLGLQRLAGYPLYIVTDGNKLVQRSKLTALGVTGMVKKALVTHQYGVRNAKPSAHCFQLICRWEKVRPEQVVYIGDNPRKDFKGIRPLGFLTVRLLQGQHRQVEVPSAEDAEWRISSLDELTDSFLDGIFGAASRIGG